MFSLKEEKEEEVMVERKWTRSTPAEQFYNRDKEGHLRGTERLQELCSQFEHDLTKRSERAREGKPKYEPPPQRHKPHLHKCKWFIIVLCIPSKDII
jgi:hypothetical protein